VDTSRTASSTIFPLLGARDVGHGDDAFGHVARRGVLADVPPDAIDERVVERDAVAQPHEQHDPLVAGPPLADDEALHDLGSCSTWR
jgi:hypothetical protein